MKNFKRAVEETGTTTAAGKMHYLHTLLHGEAIWEFYELASHNSGTNNSRLKLIREGLLGYFPPINALSKKKRVMRCAVS